MDAALGRVAFVFARWQGTHIFYPCHHLRRLCCLLFLSLTCFILSAFVSHRMEEDSRPHEDSIAQFRTKLVVYKFNSPSPRYRRSANLEPSSSQASQASTESDVLPVFHKSTPASTTEPDTDDELPVATTNPRKRARRSAEPSPGASSRKAKKPKRGYAPPETYEHLHMLPDYLGQYLDST